MSHYLEKAPALKDGKVWDFMHHILLQVKSHRGLTSFIERSGVNGRWLKAELPNNIRVSLFFKIIEIKARYQTDEEFLCDWQATGRYILRKVRNQRNPPKQ